MPRKRLTRRDFMERAAGAAALSLGGPPALLAPAAQTARETSTAAGEAGAAQNAGACPPSRLENFGKGYKPRYAGPRWQMIFGSYQGIETFALNELQRMVQQYLPYVLEVQAAQRGAKPSAQVFLLGTAANNPLIAELESKGLISVPGKPESYTCACLASPWNPERRCVVIAGADAAGTLHGVMHFNKKLAGSTPEGARSLPPILDGLGHFHEQESPVIEKRGLWTWGYVIYDYRRFLDNMARLRMNRLLFWNDVPPLDCPAIIDDAHLRGIQVVLGFPWGWGMEDLDPNSPADRQAVKAGVLCRIDQMHGRLGMDAIYFQTFTETRRQEIAGKPIAALACDWVNDIGGAVLAHYPDLRIEWGVHATSIMENYKLLEKLDRRIVIVWEDAGVIPYAYDPVAHSATGSVPDSLNSPRATLDYSRRLASLRPGSEFAMVAKGWTTLPWRTEFEHHQLFILGERAPDFIRRRLQQRQPRWDEVNRLWLENFPQALRFYRGIRDATPAQMTVLGLIEDGLFEEKIQFSAALLGEMIWNPRRSDREILAAARNPYYARITA